MSRAFWRIAGLLIGIALAALAWLAPQSALDGATTALGLDTLTPLARPPLGQHARLALAAGGLVAGLLLAFLLGTLARRHGDETETVTGGSLPEMRYDPLAAAGLAMPAEAVPPRTDHQPMPETAIPDAYPAEPVAAGFALAPTEIAEPAFAEAEPEPEPEPERKPQPEPDPAPVYAGGPITVDSGPVPIPAELPASPPQTVAHAHAQPDPALAAALARVEAAIADLAQHGPAHVGTRLDAIDARMGQMALQIAELAGLARAAARSPAAAPAPAPTYLRPPADPARRAAVGAAARALRERLDREG